MLLAKLRNPLIIMFAIAATLCFPLTALADDLTAIQAQPVQTQAGSELLNAEEIPLNWTTSDALASYRDEHWYKVTLPSAGRFQVVFGGDYQAGNGRWKIEFRDANNEEIWSRTHHASEVTAETFGLTGLPAGSYYLIVSDYWNDVSGLTYNLFPDFQPSSDWEREFNGGLQLANAIPTGVATYGSIRSSRDVDWYTFSLPSARRFQVVFGGDYQAGNGEWAIELRDANNEEIWSRRHNTSDVTAETFGLTGLPAGNYYLIVSQYWSDVSDLAYSIIPDFQPNPAWETEFNGGLQSADAIPVGSATYGSIRSGNDVDWYTFSLPSAGRFEVTFGGDYRASGGSWKIELKDANNEEIWNRTHSSREVTTETFGVTGLPAGVYYLVVREYSGDVADAAYNLTPVFKASSKWEAEFNETIVTANEVPLGKTIYGANQSNRDEDWFKVEIPKTGKFQIAFNADYSTSNDYWRISLRDWRNNEIQENTYRASTKSAKIFASKGKLAAGVYYIKISDGPTDLAYNFKPGYYVAKTSISKITAKSSAFKVKWSKKKGTTRYQIRYSTKSSMKKAKVVDASKKSSVKEIANLKAKKRYHVQVRVGKKIAGTMYYSTWSKKASVKTK